MSLGIVIKGPEGLVLAAESRVTLKAQLPEGSVHVGYDNAKKLLSFNNPSNTANPSAAIGVVTYGLAAIGLRTPHSFVPEFENELPENERLPVEKFARRLSDFFMKQWEEEGMDDPDDYSGPNITFVVGGYDESEPYGSVFLLEIPKNPVPVEQHKGQEFGITWGGQREFVDRLIQGYDHKLLQIVAENLDLQPEQIQAIRQQAAQILQMRMPLQAMPLQDCVDLAIFFIRTTIDAQRLTIGVRGSGGPIDVATITRRGGLEYVQQKKIKGERGVAPQQTFEGGI